MIVSDSPIMVSVSCITYNHENYIAEAIEGFIMQKTNFPFEILIHDDASTDRTPEIIQSYAPKYPDLIKPIYQTENQYSKGIKPALKFNFPRAKGKYIAICEGDDYWTDPYKLQKQVDFLDSNPGHSVCFHLAYRLDHATGKKTIQKIRKVKPSYDLSDLLRGNFIPTASIMFRRSFLVDLPDWFSVAPAGDWMLLVLLAQHGKIGFINQAMSVYRVHDGGIWSGANQLERNKIMEGIFSTLQKYLGPKYEKHIRVGFSDYLLALSAVNTDQGNFKTAKTYLIRSIMECPLHKDMRILDRLVLFIRLYTPPFYKLIKYLQKSFYISKKSSRVND